MTPTDMTRRLLLGAIPALGIAGAASAQVGGGSQVTGTRVVLPGEDETISLLDAWVDMYGRPTAKVMLNGQGPFNFMVDTGSTTTVIGQRHIERIGATLVGMATVNGTTGAAEIPVAQVALLETGAVRKENVRIAVLQDSNLSRADGILGADVFAGKKLVFNIQDKIVRVEPSRRPTRAAPRGNMRVRDGLLAEVDGRIGSVSAKLMLDTGAEHCIINPVLSEALRKAHPRLERVEKAKVVGVTGHVIVGEFIALPKVDFKSFYVKDAGAVAANAPIFDIWGLNKEPAMIVGVNLLSLLESFSIDYGSKTFDAKLLSLMIARNGVAFG